MAALKIERLAVMIALGVLGGGCYRAPVMPAAVHAVAVAAPLLDEGRTLVGTPAEHASVPLTVDDAITRALLHDPKLAELRARVALAVARSEEANDLDDPELRLTQVRLNDDFDERGDVTLRAHPPSPGVLRARVCAAQARVEQARAELERGEQLVSARVAGLFDECLLLSQAVALAARAVEIDARRASLADREREHGVATRIDSTKAAGEAAAASYRAAVWHDRLADARAVLMEALGLAATEPIALAGDAPDPSAATGGEVAERAMVERALRARPDVRSAGSRIDAAKAEAWIEGTRSWPQLSFVQVGYEFEPGSDHNAWTVGMAVDLPLFGFHRDSVRRAQADTLLAESAFTRTVYEVVAEVRSGLRRLDDAAAAVERFRAGPLRAAATARDAARVARDAGAADERDVLMAERRWLEARQKEIELLRVFARARVDLRTALGAAADVWASSSRLPMELGSVEAADAVRSTQ